VEVERFINNNVIRPWHKLFVNEELRGGLKFLSFGEN
jgi:hypothetical protein